MLLINPLSLIPSDAIEAIEQFIHVAQTDSLTGLKNQNAWCERRQQQALKGSLVVALDLKGLKAANQKFGQDGGDRLLQQAAAELRLVFRRSDELFRSGGDEFFAIIGADDRSRIDMLDANKWHVGIAVVETTLYAATQGALENLKVAKESGAAVFA